MTTGRSALTVRARTERGPDRFQFHTVDGVTSPDAFRPAELTLCDALWEHDPGRLLCVQANYGVTGVLSAPVARSVTMTETSARAARCCERNAAANGVQATVELQSVTSTFARTFDDAGYAPRSYTPLSVGKQHIANALAALDPGGSLFVAGRACDGINRYEDCLAELGATPTTVTTTDDCRVLRATRPEHFDPPAYVTERVLTPTIDGVDLTLVSVPGLFAAAKLDDGTRLLAEAVDIGDGERVLDLCCGYGPLGTFAATTSDCTVWLTDDHRTATQCCERSLHRSGVDGTVITADGVDGVRGRTFDRILTNPPTHAGSGVLTELFAGAYDLLARDGTVDLVHHRELDLTEFLAPFDSIVQRRSGDEHVVVRAQP